ncbi:AT-rich interaction domain 6 [Cololabis saira]|uniref:AT-rich interaction domain 6 n=1 Tax=Cololabis saira TaxID=129043 RepID=UPI002AD3B4F5|nr:AT-rich interaction domain 6 [Cololabis saira]
MAHTEVREEKPKDPMEDITEEQFLKNLYLFMKKRDTPIERIPNLGFKQIDLFVMFKTVGDLGGYHQVTSHQLWKQVYSVLGGNPRSTSAATCTRRHYEKLLLPYECHLKGIMISTAPQLPPRPCRYSTDEDGGQRHSKRRLVPVHMPLRFQSIQSDPSRSLYHLPLHYPHYYNPGHPLLPLYGLIPPTSLPSHGSPVLKPQFPLQPPNLYPRHLDSADVVKEPLEQLRYLAERYKTSSGLTEPLTEPLNLSVNAQETNSNPVSSFSPLSSSKNPKFLNKPSTLYTSHHSGSLRHEGSETQGVEESEEVTAFSYHPEERTAQVVEVRAFPPSGSPICISPPTVEADEYTSEMEQGPNLPTTDFPTRPAEHRERSQETMGLTFSHELHSLPQQEEGRMEIEVPLSVFRNWLKLCRSSAMLHEPKDTCPSDHEEILGQRSGPGANIHPPNLMFHANRQHLSSAEDLSMRDESSPVSKIQKISHQHGSSQEHITFHKRLPWDEGQNNASSCELWPPHQQDMDKSRKFNSIDFWDAYKEEILAPFNSPRRGSSPLGAAENFTSKFNYENKVTGRKTTEMEPSPLMLNPSSTSVLHLTTDEVVKLKKIISNSS